VFRRRGGKDEEETSGGVVVAEPENIFKTGLESRMRDHERTTRKKSDLWDRVKLLFLFAVLFSVFFWQEVADNPIRSLNDALLDTFASKTWLLVLAGLEVLRQIHFLIAERWSGYYLVWRNSVFGRTESALMTVDPWTRFRVGRAIKWAFFITMVSIVLGALFDESAFTALVTLPARLVSWMPLLMRIVMYMFIIIGQFAMLFWFLSRGGVETYFPDDIDTRFDDVWGQDNVKEKIQENLIFLENPEAIEDKGGYTPGGILLWGPPGTGKTLLAEAAAGETGKPFVFVDPGAFINMFMGVGILKVKSLFRKLRKLALRYGGVIVFFDEADSLGNRGALAGPGGQFGAVPSNFDDRQWDSLRYMSDEAREHVYRHAVLGQPIGRDPSGPLIHRDGIIVGGMGGGGMGTLQALLTELSGLKKPRGFFNRTIRKALGMRPKPPPKYRILVMMASNMPQSLDEALLRPGRIDRIYKVGYPPKDGRIRTYEGYLDKVRHCLTAEEVEQLAVMTPYATGAVIKDMVNEALIEAIRDGRSEITYADMIRAKRLKSHGPPDDVEYVERERHAVAIHEACHAVAAFRARKHLTIDTATIEKGSTFLGMVSSVKVEDRFTTWRSEYEANIVVSLASLAGERMFFDGDNSSGVSADLEAATTLAIAMEGYWGMGSTVASHGVTRGHGVGAGPGGIPGDDDDEESNILDGTLGDRIEANLRRLLDEAEQLLIDNRAQVLAVAHALEKHKTITGEDVAAIIDGREGPLIDGSNYYSAEALEMLETYHEEQHQAHRENDAAPIPLPDIRTTRFDSDRETPIIGAAFADPSEAPEAGS
jgi:cell division protease FtsH